jgi:hypothetical protein
MAAILAGIRKVADIWFEVQAPNYWRESNGCAGGEA